MLNVFSLNKQTAVSYKKEIIGGIANFMAICYIVIINPLILNANGQGFPLMPTITATILTIIIMTTLAGFIIKLPFVMAPGMGLNAMVAYTFAVHQKLAVPTILGIILWSSIILFVFSVTNLRQKIINAIPETIQTALSIGIGLFLILVGLKNAQIIISNPNTLMSMHKIDTDIALCFAGFIIASILFIRGKIYSMILPIIIITILSFATGSIKLPTQIMALPDFSLFGSIDLTSSFKLSLIPAVISLFLVMFFDATSSVIGLLSQLEYETPKLKQQYYKRALLSDAIGGMVSGITGTSPTAIFVESSVGVHNGATTGFASLITAMLCIPFLFFSPIISVIPASATSPILILVGMLMVNNFRKLNLYNFEDFIPVVLTSLMIPLCFSITAGAVFGIISYTILKLLLGKFDEVSPSLIIIAICCCFWFIL